MKTFLLMLCLTGICYGANRYKIVTSSDSTQIGKIVSHREIPPILEIGENGILIGEDKTYTLVVQETTKNENKTDNTFILILGVIILVAAVFFLTKSKIKI